MFQSNWVPIHTEPTALLAVKTTPQRWCIPLDVWLRTQANCCGPSLMPLPPACVRAAHGAMQHGRANTGGGAIYSAAVFPLPLWPWIEYDKWRALFQQRPFGERQQSRREKGESKKGKKIKNKKKQKGRKMPPALAGFCLAMKLQFLSAPAKSSTATATASGSAGLTSPIDRQANWKRQA